jgi:hypothetical protein
MAIRANEALRLLSAGVVLCLCASLVGSGVAAAEGVGEGVWPPPNSKEAKIEPEGHIALKSPHLADLRRKRCRSSQDMIRHHTPEESRILDRLPRCKNDPGTPLVFVFDSKAVSFVDAPNHFELVKPGSGTTTDWPTAHTPWLVLDRNGNGSIDDGRELFGSMTVLPDGRVAENGFEALAALDENRDGRIDKSDPAFAQLRLWADVDADRRSSPAELTSLAQIGIESIELRYHVEPRCDARGNCEFERAGFTWHDQNGVRHQGEVVDIHLGIRVEALSER